MRSTKRDIFQVAELCVASPVHRGSLGASQGIKILSFWGFRKWHYYSAF